MGIVAWTPGQALHVTPIGPHRVELKVPVTIAGKKDEIVLLRPCLNVVGPRSRGELGYCPGFSVDDRQTLGSWFGRTEHHALAVRRPTGKAIVPAPAGS